jgi:hypothetical protein
VLEILVLLATRLPLEISITNIVVHPAGWTTMFVIEISKGNLVASRVPESPIEYDRSISINYIIEEDPY